MIHLAVLFIGLLWSPYSQRFSKMVQQLQVCLPRCSWCSLQSAVGCMHEWVMLHMMMRDRTTFSSSDISLQSMCWGKKKACSLVPNFESKMMLKSWWWVSSQFSVNCVCDKSKSQTQVLISDWKSPLSGVCAKLRLPTAGYGHLKDSCDNLINLWI